MALIGLSEVRLSYGGPMILDGVSIQIEPGERVGLVGRNGAGKSSLLKVIEGRLVPDEGSVTRQQGTRVAGLAQEVPRDLGGTVGDLLRGVAESVPDFEAWEVDGKIERLAEDLKLNLNQDASILSAGSKRRVLLAQALILEPDVLVLDEPTNHLDIDVIGTLEKSLQRFRGALVFVTHDRSFLKRLATRILDLDRGELRSYRCDYATYLDRREAELEAESSERQQFDKKLAKEETWIRRGVKARRARNQGRVRALKKMREEHQARRQRAGSVRASIQEAEKSGRLVLKVEGIHKAFEGVKVIEDFSTVISRGDRIGIVGPNGCGKSTLLRLLLGELEPDSGEIARGTRFEVAHFDQLHLSLDETKTLQENVGEGSDKIDVGGVSRHIMGYLQDFLFTPEQIRSPIRKLSGGERNRLQLAKILAKPCNVLVLDEPTNDLDIETLELLENLLVEFAGTILLVSHDREFLNNVVTSTIVFERGTIKEYEGGYDDWLRQRPVVEDRQKTFDSNASRKNKSKKKPAKARRLNNKERAELEKLPERIQELESEKEVLHTKMASPDFYKRDASVISEAKARIESIDAEIDKAMERWTKLETIASGEG